MQGTGCEAGDVHLTRWRTRSSTARCGDAGRRQLNLPFANGAGILTDIAIASERTYVYSGEAARKR